MKKFLILIVGIVVVSTGVWAAFGQASGEDRRGALRQRWNNMSEQEKEQISAQMRERFSSRREEQLKAIKTIEEQLAKLKESAEGMSRDRRSEFREMSPEEKIKFREQWTKMRKERQEAIKAIIAQMAILQGRRQPPAESEELVIVSTNELKAIQELALKEKATETAERLEEFNKGRPDIGARQFRAEKRPSTTKRQEMRVKEVKAEKKAPQFTLNSFDGKTVSLSDYRGKMVVLEWFNFECPFVRYHYDTVSTMVELANKYKDKNVIWLAINSTSHITPQANNEFAKKHKLPYPILDDRDGKVGRAYGAKTTPHIFIIDVKGNIAYEGAIDNSPMGRVKKGVINYVDKTLTKLIGGKPVSIAESKPYGCSVKYAD